MILQAISKPPLRLNLGVGSRSPILEIVDYYCGCPPRSALIFNLIEGFEMACKQTDPKNVVLYFSHCITHIIRKIHNTQIIIQLIANFAADNLRSFRL
jgi:hypothetical protein